MKTQPSILYSIIIEKNMIYWLKKLKAFQNWYYTYKVQCVRFKGLYLQFLLSTQTPPDCLESDFTYSKVFGFFQCSLAELQDAPRLKSEFFWQQFLLLGEHNKVGTGQKW